MMTTTATKTADARPRDAKLWDPRQDRQIYLVWIAINWIGMIAGFGHDFSRYLSQKPGPPLLIHIHAAVWPMFFYIFWGNLLLLALMTAWDLWRRRSLNPAFAIGAVLLLASEFAAVILYLGPMWKQVATAIVRAWGYAG